MNEKTTIVIDLANYNGPVYSGRHRGELIRSSLDLDGADKNAQMIDVCVPDNTFTISSSFFLGLFGPSIVNAGSKEAFYKRFHIKMPEFLREPIDSYVARALQTKNLFS